VERRFKAAKFPVAKSLDSFVCCNARNALIAIPERVASIISRKWPTSADDAVGISP
jgi:hypothetical protein